MNTIEYYEKLWKEKFLEEKLEEAKAVIQEAEEHYPDSCEPLYGLTEYYIKKGEFSSALTNLLYAREIEEHQPELYFITLANIYFHLKDKVSAIEVCKEGIREYPGTMELRYLLSRFFCALNKFDSADIVAREAIKINPQDGRFYYITGYIATGNFEAYKAVDIYKKLIDRIPAEEIKGLFNTGFAFLSMNKPDEAEKVWKELLEKYPDDKRTLYALELLAKEKEAFL